MPCYHPVLGYRSRTTNPSGKRSIVFNPNEGYPDLQVTLPCGQCVGCRLERSRQWAIRCVHESQQHEENCFITLTFDKKHLNEAGSLVKSDFQKFMKRLRKSAINKVRYFHCGEYGDKLGRPHHHACLFGHDFPDKELYSVRNGINLYKSKQLEKIWGMGFCTIGEVNFETCAYVARYIMKKITGKQAETVYKDKIPPYNTMSRRPGIGAEWFNSFAGDVYPDDFIVIRDNIKCKPPNFYDDKYGLTDPADLIQIKKHRRKAAERRKNDNSLERLHIKEELKLQKLKLLERSYENGTESI